MFITLWCLWGGNRKEKSCHMTKGVRRPSFDLASIDFFEVWDIFWTWSCKVFIKLSSKKMKRDERKRRYLAVRARDYYYDLMLLCLGVFLGIYWSLIPWRSFFKKLNLRELISSKPLQNWEKNKKRKWFRYFTYFTLLSFSVFLLKHTPVPDTGRFLHCIISVVEINMHWHVLIESLVCGYPVYKFEQHEKKNFKKYAKIWMVVKHIIPMKYQFFLGKAFLDILSRTHRYSGFLNNLRYIFFSMECIFPEKSISKFL